MTAAKNNQTEAIIKTVQLCKNFGPTQALDNVNFEVFTGGITGLIGENGSGKSTLSSIIAGMQAPSSGEMFYKAQPHKPRTMLEAGAQGIGMIVQEQGYVPGITIAQNIYLGEEQRFRKNGLISMKEMAKSAQAALDRIGFEGVSATALIDTLDIQDRKLVEIARVMSKNPEVLVVDETTTALSQKGRAILYDIIKKMRADKKAVIFISHDLAELMEYCDSMTVLRDGKLIRTLDKAEFDEKLIKTLMVGRDIGDRYYREDFGTKSAPDKLIDVSSITTGSGMLRNFTMQVFRGEILGIGGLSHCGMHELGKAIFGEEKILRGQVTHLPSGKTIKNPQEALGLGFGYVSKDRDKEALVLTASIKDNIASAGYDKLKKGPFIFPKSEKAYVRSQIDKLSIKCAGMNQNVQYLSGGNKQKVVFGKWVGRDCDVLILDCPTRGVDVGVKAAMYQLMDEMRAAGKTIIMISEELPELLGMSDRILILKDGRLAAEFARDAKLSEHDVIDYMI